MELIEGKKRETVGAGPYVRKLAQKNMPPSVSVSEAGITNHVIPSICRSALVLVTGVSLTHSLVSFLRLASTWPTIPHYQPVMVL